MSDFITCTDALVLGIHEIDQQHLELVRIINRLAEVVSHNTDDTSSVAVTTPTDSALILNGLTKRATSSETLGYIHQILDELITHTNEHFKYEEELMARHNYPALNEHKREHVMLRAELVSLVRDIKCGSEVLDEQILAALKEWLIAHIRVSDKSFAEQLNL